MKISPETRAEAALICALAASNADLHESYDSVVHAAGMEFSGPAHQLALDAWNHVDWILGRDMYSDGEGWVDAEAEALLLTGWSP